MAHMSTDVHYLLRVRAEIKQQLGAQWQLEAQWQHETSPLPVAQQEAVIAQYLQAFLIMQQTAAIEAQGPV